MVSSKQNLYLTCAKPRFYIWALKFPVLHSKPCIFFRWVYSFCDSWSSRWLFVIFVSHVFLLGETVCWKCFHPYHPSSTGRQGWRIFLPRSVLEPFRILKITGQKFYSFKLPQFDSCKLPISWFFLLPMCFFDVGGWVEIHKLARKKTLGGIYEVSLVSKNLHRPLETNCLLPFIEVLMSGIQVVLISATPPKTNIATQNDGPWKRWLRL